ncbi:hypothetical protein [Nonomuraea sp. NPDC023979]|uniref:hypothetical protein n=1 Tax=Nonomuraea sp. NPDC023979 TaxID=3154796 RepID=UPI0034045409
MLPDAERVEFAKLNHGGSGNRNRGGNPPLVARELHRFFTSAPQATEVTVAVDETNGEDATARARRPRPPRHRGAQPLAGKRRKTGDPSRRER